MIITGYPEAIIMNIGHFLVDGIFDAALQAKVLYVKAVHGWMDQYASCAHSRSS